PARGRSADEARKARGWGSPPTRPPPCGGGAGGANFPTKRHNQPRREEIDVAASPSTDAASDVLEVFPLQADAYDLGEHPPKPAAIVEVRPGLRPAQSRHAGFREDLGVIRSRPKSPRLEEE